MVPVGHVSPDGYWRWDGTQWVPAAPPQPATGYYGPPSPRAFESARFRSQFVIVFIAIYAIAVFLGIVVDFMLIGVGGDLANASNTAEIGIGLVAILFLLAYYGSLFPAIVLFCMWLHRVVRNMPALGSDDPRWTPAGAVGRCFIPFLNYVHPLRSTLDAWRGADPRHRSMNVIAREVAGTPAMIGIWWACWLIGGLATNIASRVQSSNDAGTVVAGSWMHVFSSLVLIAAAVLAILVVRDVTGRQDRKQWLISMGQLV